MKFVFNLYLFTLIFSTFIFALKQTTVDIVKNNSTLNDTLGDIKGKSRMKSAIKKHLNKMLEDADEDDENSKIVTKGQSIKSDETVLIVEKDEEYDSVKVNFNKNKFAINEDQDDDFDSSKPIPIQSTDQNNNNEQDDDDESAIVVQINQKNQTHSLNSGTNGNLTNNDEKAKSPQNKKSDKNAKIKKSIKCKSKTKTKMNTKPSSSKNLTIMDGLKYKCNLNYVDFDNRPFVDGNSCSKDQVYDILLMLCLDSACIPDATNIDRSTFDSKKLVERLAIIEKLKKKKLR